MFIELGRRLLTLLRRSRFDADLDEEMRLHRELREREQIERGVSPEEARYAAQRRFGNDLALREESRDMWGWNWLESLLQDLRYGLRQLKRNPGFSAIAVITLALGIGANTAMFSVVNAVLFRPLPFRNPGLLMAIDGIPAIRLNGMHNRSFGWRDWVSKTRTLEGVCIYETGGVNISDGEQPEHLPAAAVSANFFRLLGVEPWRGRTFLPDEETPGHAVAIVSYDLWQGHFGSDRGIIGRGIELGGRPFTVVGAMPPEFEFPADTQVWVPTGANLAESLFGEQAVANRQIARLRPGVNIAQARSELGVFLSHLDQGHVASFNPKLSMIPLRLELVKDVRPALLVLMGAVGLVLLIACADVANLFMVRNAGRSREVAIRIAMGASRSRLLRQLLTESLLVSLAGGATGLLLAVAGARLAGAILPESQVSATGIRLDARVMAFTFAVALFTGIASGLLPALGSSKAALTEALKEAAGGWIPGIGAARGNRLRSGLGSLEVTLALVLLIGAGLLIKSLYTLSQVNPGFRADHLLSARVFLTGPGYAPAEKRTAFFEQILDGARRLPAVREAAFVNSVPMGQGVSVMYSVGIEGSPTPNAQTSGKFAMYFAATPDYFRVMGIPLLAGREFDERDAEGSPPVVIISQTMARQFWPNQDPVGKRITMVDPPKWMTVQGVVGDVRQFGLAEKSWAAMYVPVLQHPPASAFLLLHNSRPVPATDVSRVVRHVDTAEPVASVRTVEDLLSRSTAAPRFRAEVLGIFAGLAILLALVGIYGIVSYSVAQRTHEIGVRMALGATRDDVLRMVVGQGFRLTLIGVAIGLIGAFGLTRFLSSMLYGVKPTDPLTFVAVSIILTAVALGAGYIPALRATKVDPMVALRHE